MSTPLFEGNYYAAVTVDGVHALTTPVFHYYPPIDLGMPIL